MDISKSINRGTYTHSNVISI